MLHLPEGEVRISLNMRERELKGVRKVVHGHGRWHLNGLGLNEEYTDLVPLMRALSARLAMHLGGGESTSAPYCPLGDPAADVPPELPHLARRFSSARPVRQKRPPVVRHDEEEGRLERLRRLEDARAASQPRTHREQAPLRPWTKYFSAAACGFAAADHAGINAVE